jgi:hypothetical protein
MQQDDFISAVLDTVSSNVSMSKAARAKIDAELRQQWAGAPVYIKKREPTYRESIRAAVGTHEEIAKMYSVSVRTVFRVRKGR